MDCSRMPRTFRIFFIKNPTLPFVPPKIKFNTLTLRSTFDYLSSVALEAAVILQSSQAVQLVYYNLRSSSKFAIAIVLTKQSMGVTVIILIILPGSKVTVQEKVGRLNPQGF